MALASYQNLLDAIEGWLHRGDLTAQIPDFVRLAEAEIHRRNETRSVEDVETGSFTAGSRTFPLPADFDEATALYMEGLPALEVVSLRELYRANSSTERRQPKDFAVSATEGHLSHHSDADYNYSLLYKKRLPALEDEAHAFFLANPDLYLYGALLEAEPFVKDGEFLAWWEKRYEKAWSSIKKQDKRSRYSGGTLRARADTRA